VQEGLKYNPIIEDVSLFDKLHIPHNLTKREKFYYDCLIEFLRENSEMPSLREIAEVYSKKSGIVTVSKEAVRQIQKSLFTKIRKVNSDFEF